MALTPREFEVVLLFAEGHNGESIGHQLGISVETVKRHTSNICEELGFNSRHEIICWYYKTYWRPKRDEEVCYEADSRPEVRLLLMALRLASPSFPEAA